MMQLKPEQFESTVTFGRGQKIHFRAIRPSDAGLLLELFKSHSADTILHRYFVPLKELSQDQVDKFVNIDFANDMAIVGLVTRENTEHMVCVGRYYRDTATNQAEFAITLHDDFHHRGIGTYLLRLLIEIARQQGLVGFYADMLADNYAMLHLVQKCTDALGLRLETNLAAGVCHVSFLLGKPHRHA